MIVGCRACHCPKAMQHMLREANWQPISKPPLCALFHLPPPHPTQPAHLSSLLGSLSPFPPSQKRLWVPEGLCPVAASFLRQLAQRGAHGCSTLQYPHTMRLAQATGCPSATPSS